MTGRGPARSRKRRSLEFSANQLLRRCEGPVPERKSCHSRSGRTWEGCQGSLPPAYSCRNPIRPGCQLPVRNGSPELRRSKRELGLRGQGHTSQSALRFRPNFHLPSPSAPRTKFTHRTSADNCLKRGRRRVTACRAEAIVRIHPKWKTEAPRDHRAGNVSRALQEDPTGNGRGSGFNLHRDPNDERYEANSRKNCPGQVGIFPPIPETYPIEIIRVAGGLSFFHSKELGTSSAHRLIFEPVLIRRLSYEPEYGLHRHDRRKSNKEQPKVRAPIMPDEQKDKRCDGG